MQNEKNAYSDTAVTMLRANLGFFDSKLPDELTAYLGTLLAKAAADFSEMKVVLQPGNVSDDFDQAAYAAWLYRNGPTGAGKTEMIRNIIRNRQVNQALRGEEVTP